MPSGKTNHCLALAGLLLWAAVAVDWISGIGLQAAPWPVRAAWLGVALLLAAGYWRSTRARITQLRQALAAGEIRDHHKDTQVERFSSILAGLSEPIIAVDQHGQLVLTNPSAEKLFDLPSQSTGQQALAQLQRCEKLVELLADTRHRETREQRTLEVEIADDQGQLHWFNATARPLTDAAEDRPTEGLSPQGAVAVLRDISAQKTVGRRNAEFVSAVSHEMKTPLAGIKAYVELLADGDADDAETQAEFLAVINSQTNRLQRLVDNLLKLARIEAGVATVNKQACSLNELLGEALLAVRSLAEEKRLALVAELGTSDLEVLADHDMLIQVAVNLLVNAINYTPAGGRIVLFSRLVGDEVQFSVQDNGVGLSAEDAVRVFEKFYRVQKDKDMAAGTGLGLPLAKHIVEDLHGGRLTVDSVLGRESVFAVTLPGSGQKT